MSRSWPETTRFMVVAVLVALSSGCAATGPVAQSSSIVSDTPDEALRAFVQAWNAGDFARVRATFHPERRPLLDARRADVTRRMERWRIQAAKVDALCHPRGGAWKNTTFVRVAPDAQESDAAWVRLDGGSWWMYSL